VSCWPGSSGLKGVLASEGLFDAERKSPLPFLPRTVGLITGRASAAERDVLENARRRWPAVRFEIREVAVQGHLAVEQVVDALRALDRMPEVDVVVIARGGGSVEDLLPFSDEALCRAVVACRTPVVSAIGHEPDSPLLDLVADVRCSTPTDAGKRVVPDVAEERTRVRQARDRAHRVVVSSLARERAGLTAALSRPVLADPSTLVRLRRDDVEGCSAGPGGARRRSSTGRGPTWSTPARASSRCRRRPPSTAATPWCRAAAARSCRDPGEVVLGERLRVRLAGGELGVTAG
jgi:exodeoxyribonuclease VII large subunit